MKTQIKNILLTASLIVGLSCLSLLFVSAPASAQFKDKVCEGVNATGGGGNCTDAGAASATVNSIVTTVINVMSFLVGVIAVIMIIIGGIKFITAGGDSNNISSAKNTILYALIGLVVAALAQVIVRFVLTRI